MNASDVARALIVRRLTVDGPVPAVVLLTRVAREMDRLGARRKNGRRIDPYATFFRMLADGSLFVRPYLDWTVSLVGPDQEDDPCPETPSTSSTEAEEKKRPRSLIHWIGHRSRWTVRR